MKYFREKSMMKKIKMFIVLSLVSGMALMMTACSDDKKVAETKKEKKTDHVWKTQTDALQSAKDSAKKMQEELEQQQKKLEQSN
jgi:ABC-type glycerol-3-phosphate transport system substrate-binding protein